MRPLGLYLHWPYCARVCPYCDFTVTKARLIDEDAWRHVLLDDLRRFAGLCEKRPLRSVYFGGGTPSLMPLSVGAAVLEEAERLFGLEPGCELTIEANPDDRGLFADWRAAGFNRLSLGVQSFSDDALRFLGRNHDSADALAGAAEAVSVFPEVSLDLIYALPEQALSSWLAELRRAAGFGSNHLSLYQLTIEPGTAFGKAAARGRLTPMPDERSADFYEATQEATDELGLPAYEVSNHARPGSEAVHNALYWREADWLAIGPGAHGRIGPHERRLATEGSHSIRDYPRMPFDRRHMQERLSDVAVTMEAIAGGLRPLIGLDLRRLGPHRAAVDDAARPLVEEGFLVLTEHRLAATMRGRLLLDQLTAELVSALPEGDPA